MVPKGYYEAIAVPVVIDDETVWAQFGETGNGNPQVVIHYEIAEAGEWKGRRLPWFGYFTDDATDRTLESIRVSGFDGDDLAKLPKTPLKSKVSITVEHNEFEGKTHARVAWVNKPGGAILKVANPLNQKGVKALSEKLATKLGKIPF
jgi:hypothetical protein